jgi:phytoene synthase
MPDTTSPALNTSASPALSPGIDPALMQPLDAEARRSLMRGGSKTFFAASLLLPSRVREPATALYAYCRLADDAVDMGEDPHAAGRALTQRLDAIYEGRPGPVEVDRALAQVVHRYAIPRSLPDALLEGFLWDAQGRRFHTLSDVQAYGARVAGAVGAMMALVMETRGPQAGVDADAWMRAPVFTPAIGSVVQRLLRAADVLYERAAAGIADLPLDCRPAIQAACRVYAEIGHQLEREGLDSVSRRAVVSKGRKIALLAASTGAALMHSPFGRKPLAPLPEIAYLVEAVQQCEARPASSAPRRSFDQRMEWATDLYARLIDREQQRSQGRQSRA